MQEVLSPILDGEFFGKAIVQELFNIGATGYIAGSKCKAVIIRKGSNVKPGDAIAVK